MKISKHGILDQIRIGVPTRGNGFVWNTTKLLTFHYDNSKQAHDSVSERGHPFLIGGVEEVHCQESESPDT